MGRQLALFLAALCPPWSQKKVIDVTDSVSTQRLKEKCGASQSRCKVESGHNNWKLPCNLPNLLSLILKADLGR